MSSSVYDLVLERTLDAPCETVWRAWTDPKRVARWWGPRGFTARIEQLDLRVGGAWRYVMLDSDGSEYPSVGEFLEISAPERLVTTDEFPDDFEYGDPDELPQGTVLTASFAAAGERRTQLTLTIAHPTAEDRRKHEDLGVVEGWESTLDRLAAYLAT
jgi:uncharacterized protein YndB with AHSA1/START domain